MRSRSSRTSLAMAALLLLGSSCGHTVAKERATMVFASASLTEVFQALRDAYVERERDAELELHFAGTPRLLAQLREGAPADVFAAADLPSMSRLLESADDLRSRTFAKNRLAIAVGAGNPKDVRELADLARPELKVAMCGPEVPAGRYARTAQQKAGVVIPSLSDEPSVKALLSKVQLGELDAGIVYATDLLDAGDLVEHVEIPDASNVVAEYPIAVLDAAGPNSTAASFVDFVLSTEGRRILRSFGFEAP